MRNPSDQNWYDGRNELEIRTVNYFFAKCERLYAGTFKARFPTELERDRGKSEWADSIAPMSRDLIDAGFKRIRQQHIQTGKDPVWPGIPAVLKACNPTLEDLGMPSPEEAWCEVLEHCCQAETHPWSHRAVLVAGHLTGWAAIRNADSEKKRRALHSKFNTHYRAMVRRVTVGDALEEASEVHEQSGMTDVEKSWQYNQRMLDRQMVEMGIDRNAGREGSRAHLKSLGFLKEQGDA